VAPLVVVLGASGYLGTAITALLARRPVRLRAVARSPAVVPDRSVADVEVAVADLTERAAMAGAVRDADVVVHLLLSAASATWRTATGDDSGARVNVGTLDDALRVLAAPGRAGVRPAVLFAGSVAHPDDEEVSPYHRQKATGERILLKATANGAVRGISLRLPTVFGDTHTARCRHGGVVAAMVRRAIAGQPLTLWHDGSVERDLVHVDDVARAFVTAIDHADRLAGRRWPVGSGVPVRVGQLFTEIAAAVAVHTGRPPVPVVRVGVPPQATAADLRVAAADSAAFRAVTGWAPRVSRSAGLARLVEVLVDGSTRDRAP
jgi:nucleoside-diphosphate-sugar epimerase